MSKKVWSSQSKDKYLISQIYIDCLVNYVDQSDTIFKVFKLEKKDSIDSLITVRNADIDEEIDWKLYSNFNLSMSNFNSVFRIQKLVTSISAISIFSAQKVQKHEIHFEIKYFDEKFNLSKSNWSCDYNDNSTDDKNSDNQESDQKLSMKSTHLALLAALQKSDLLIYFETIQNVEISFSDEVFIIKKQLADLCMKDFVKSASYREVMNFQQHDQWIVIMQVKINKLIRIEVWKLVKLSKEQKIIKKHWVYYIKLSVNNEIVKFKAH